MHQQGITAHYSPFGEEMPSRISVFRIVTRVILLCYFTTCDGNDWCCQHFIFDCIAEWHWNKIWKNYQLSIQLNLQLDYAVLKQRPTQISTFTSKTSIIREIMNTIMCITYYHALYFSVVHFCDETVINSSWNVLECELVHIMKLKIYGLFMKINIRDS